jgi:hypothetical protein
MEQDPSWDLKSGAGVILIRFSLMAFLMSLSESIIFLGLIKQPHEAKDSLLHLAGLDKKRGDQN